MKSNPETNTIKLYYDLRGLQSIKRCVVRHTLFSAVSLMCGKKLASVLINLAKSIFLHIIILIRKIKNVIKEKIK